MVTPAQIRQLEQLNSQVLGRLTDDMGRIRAFLAPLPPEDIRDELMAVAPALVDRHGTVVAAESAAWYEQVRRSEIGGTFTARPANGPGREVVERNVRYAAAPLFTGLVMNAFSLLEGALVRHIEDMSRDTISGSVTRDRRAAGWHRLVRADACEFCLMLHGRGAIYKKNTATFASHDNCRCTAAPSWDPSAPEVPAEAYQASERMGKVRRRASDPSLPPAERRKAQRILDRQRENTRRWIDSNRSQLDALRAELM